MNLIEIKALDNGAHRNQNGGLSTVPEGWAVIPDDMVCENFPFVEVEVEEIDGVMTVTKWAPGVLPEPEPNVSTPSELREEAYNTEKIIEWGGEMITVTGAAQQWQYYAAEGSEKAEMLQNLIAEAKASIREKYPD